MKCDYFSADQIIIICFAQTNYDAVSKKDSNKPFYDEIKTAE